MSLSHPLLIRLAVAAVLVLLPVLLVFTSLANHDASRIVEVIILSVACALGFFRYRVTIPQEQTVKAAFGLVGLFVFGLLSISMAYDSSAAVLEASLLLAISLTAVVLGWSTNRRDLWPLFFVAVVASVVFFFFVAVRYLGALSAATPLLREHLLPGYSNYRFFNHVQTITIPLILAASLSASLSPLLRRWAMVALVLEFCLLFFTGGRATALALVGASVIVITVFRRDGGPWVGRLAIAAIAGAVLNFLMFSLAPTWLGLPRDFFSGDTVARSEFGVGGPRVYLWDLAIQYIREAPLWGIGPMHYAQRVNMEAAHPHNIYLQLAAEWGLPFASIVVLLALIGLVRLVRAAKNDPHPNRKTMGISLVAACVAISIDGMFSGNFVMPMSQLWIAFAFGLSIAYVSQTKQETEKAETTAVSPIASRLIGVLGLLSLIGIWQGVWPEILDVNAHIEQVRAEVPNVRDNPRFWSHGWIR